MIEWKKYFITGLVILLPAALTLAILSFLFNLLTEPFVGMVRSIFSLYEHPYFLFFSGEHIQKFVSQIIILIFLFLVTLGLGFIANWFLFHYLVRFWERILKKIPIVSNIYQTSKDVINNLFADKTNSFKQVVMISFPTSKTLTIGFITNDSVSLYKDDEKQMVAVFVPTTPNPTSGFLMMCDKADLIYTTMKVEDAFKFVISCGTILNPLDKTPLNNNKA